MAKIFISYTARDRKWADWIGVTLRDNRHVPFVHEWEIGAGGNIPRWMDERIKAADCLLAVFTDAYAGALYSSTERWAAYWNDPAGREGFLVPVEVEKVSDWPPLTKPLKRLSLVGLSEVEAETALLKFLEAPKPPVLISSGAALGGTSGLDAAAFTYRSGPLPAERPPLPASVPTTNPPANPMVMKLQTAGTVVVVIGALIGAAAAALQQIPVLASSAREAWCAVFSCGSPRSSRRIPDKIMPDQSDFIKSWGK